MSLLATFVIISAIFFSVNTFFQFFIIIYIFFFEPQTASSLDFSIPGNCLPLPIQQKIFHNFPKMFRHKVSQYCTALPVPAPAPPEDTGPGRSASSPRCTSSARSRSDPRPSGSQITMYSQIHSASLFIYCLSRILNHRCKKHNELCFRVRPGSTASTKTSFGFDMISKQKSGERFASPLIVRGLIQPDR